MKQKSDSECFPRKGVLMQDKRMFVKALQVQEGRRSLRAGVQMLPLWQNAKPWNCATGS